MADCVGLLTVVAEDALRTTWKKKRLAMSVFVRSSSSVG